MRILAHTNWSPIPEEIKIHPAHRLLREIAKGGLQTHKILEPLFVQVLKTYVKEAPHRQQDAVDTLDALMEPGLRPQLVTSTVTTRACQAAACDFHNLFTTNSFIHTPHTLQLDKTIPAEELLKALIIRIKHAPGHRDECPKCNKQTVAINTHLAGMGKSILLRANGIGWPSLVGTKANVFWSPNEGYRFVQVVAEIVYITKNIHATCLQDTTNGHYVVREIFKNKGALHWKTMIYDSLKGIVDDSDEYRDKDNTTTTAYLLMHKHHKGKSRQALINIF
jgi:hypothetical protein